MLLKQKDLPGRDTYGDTIESNRKYFPQNFSLFFLKYPFNFLVYCIYTVGDI